ncbi:MAG: hypothetical protein IT335_07325 [Thermomicrobiales bacterium]|nr:hypothetical protein [Thermomicrobiales bacterium]
MTVIDTTEIELAGSKAEQTLARDVLTLFLGRGQFMAADSPIRFKVSEIVEYLKATGKSGTEQSVAKLAESNSGVFEIAEDDGATWLMATRAGRRPVDRSPDSTHSFAERLMTPAPKPEHAAKALRPRPRGDSTWSTLERVLTDFDMGDEGDRAMRRMIEADPSSIVSQILDETIAVEEPEEEAVAARTIIVPAAPSSTDVSTVGDRELAAAVRARLGQDSRVAQFGDQWMIEDLVPRLSRGDLRRIKDYIEEQEQPLTDDVLVQDVLEVRQKASDFELMRFALNYRLAQEHRDFEFVGTNNQRFWSVSNLPPIGTTRKKATEIGTDYRFLLEELPEQPAHRSVSQLSHVLTFYEFYLGLLPYDPEMQALLPEPLTPNQRTAVLTFECPQQYTTYLVELRYPTPNRGGYLLGLDDFFNENLVAGALISIRATENDGHYIMEYEASAAQSRRLLELEERRQRYVFRPTSFSCAAFDEYLLDEDTFPGFSNDKQLDDKARRKPETVISRAFERRNNGLEGGGYGATFAELFAASNTERPFSEAFLRSVLDGDESGAFAKDPDDADAYTYIPGTIG